MNKQVVYLPFDQDCKILAEIEAGDWQRLTVTDIETNKVLIAPWEDHGEGKFHEPILLRTSKTGTDPLGYRVEVLIESAKGGQRGPWLPSRTALFAGGRVAWAYCTVGSEDCESTDNDWNDASVTFVFENLLFDPLFALAPWVAEGVRHSLKAKSP